LLGPINQWETETLTRGSTKGGKATKNHKSLKKRGEKGGPNNTWGESCRKGRIQKKNIDANVFTRVTSANSLEHGIRIDTHFGKRGNGDITFSKEKGQIQKKTRSGEVGGNRENHRESDSLSVRAKIRGEGKDSRKGVKLERSTILAKPSQLLDKKRLQGRRKTVFRRGQVSIRE